MRKQPMRKQPATAFETTSASRVAVLSVSPVPDDRSSVQSIFSHSKWALYDADRVASAQVILREYDIGVVLCERDLRPGSWIDMLERLSFLQHAPPLIVTSRLADDKLWAEALNLGAYDVLAKPFDPRAVVRSVSLAWQHWLRQHENRPETMRARAAS